MVKSKNPTAQIIGKSYILNGFTNSENIIFDCLFDKYHGAIRTVIKFTGDNFYPNMLFFRIFLKHIKRKDAIYK